MDLINSTVVVQLKSLNSINSFEDSLKGFPQNSILKITRDSFEEVKKLLKQRPLFTSVWLVYINCKLTKIQLGEILANPNLYVVINCNSKDAYEEVKDLLIDMNVKFSFIDNSTASKQELIDYTMKHLKIDYGLAEYFCKRQRYIMTKVIYNVLLLSSFDVVDKKVIDTYTVRQSSTGLLDLVEYLLGVHGKRNKYKAMVKLLYNYRYGFPFILDFTVKEINKRLELYNYIKEGELSLMNYKEFIASNNIKMSPYFVYRVLEQYRILSYDKLYLMKILVENIPSNRYAIYKYVELLKMGG